MTENLTLDLDLQTDYFRAADAAAVQKVMAAKDGKPAEAFESVRAKRIDPTTVLRRLVAAVETKEFEAGGAPDHSVWPTGPQPWPTAGDEGEVTAVDQEDPWMTGPWVVELSDETRDTLALIDRKRLPELAARWVRAEELRPLPTAELVQLIHRLGVLARRAKKADQHLYCCLSG
ncbi:hypothetical protein [Kitasatospora cheerisanensis]|uniref:Uncharacterized protein n=1 Tax=Kitasatospora cheerisanensis KCTC 2395 TaxID=1348663 RepID=A0A066YPN0_9ACTN|nr:hypothetical protein [Kitasatospora cheerisanensis]KDN81944.1 hypothetical protein KCH_62610 [Kitasatospora cheerisanensis KCTC 2395]